MSGQTPSHTPVEVTQQDCEAAVGHHGPFCNAFGPTPMGCSCGIEEAFARHRLSVQPSLPDGVGEIVERLREGVVQIGMDDCARYTPMYAILPANQSMRKAADTIVALQARVAALEGGLRPFAEAADGAERMVGHDGPLDPMVSLEACRLARALLTDAKDRGVG